MKRYNNQIIHQRVVNTVFGILMLIATIPVFADGGLTSYYKVGTVDGSVNDVKAQVEQALTSMNFEIVGGYNPGRDESMYVITFTRRDLIDITLRIGDRAPLAAILRVGLLTTAPSKVEVSLLNPEYLFYGYLRDHITKYELELNAISMDVRIALSQVGQEFIPFGGNSLSESELKEYKYLGSMPSFDDCIILRDDFGTFAQAVQTIQNNLKAQKGGAMKVYELVFDDYKIAVFGVGLVDKNKGEMKFLETLGGRHLAAMPYEIILEDTKASILHGRFRFPFFWSHLSMEDYRKIYRTPKDVEEMLKGLTKEIEH